MTGYYNLPKEEQDKYNVQLTQEELREFYLKTVKQKVKRDNKLISPVNEETLKQYVERFKLLIDSLDEQSSQEHLYGPKGPWYVHKRAQNCFICDYSTMINQSLDILIDLTKIPKVSRLAFATTKEGSQRLTTINKG